MPLGFVPVPKHLSSSWHEIQKSEKPEIKGRNRLTMPARGHWNGLIWIIYYGLHSHRFHHVWTPIGGVHVVLIIKCSPQPPSKYQMREYILRDGVHVQFKHITNNIFSMKFRKSKVTTVLVSITRWWFPKVLWTRMVSPTATIVKALWSLSQNTSFHMLDCGPL